MSPKKPSFTPLTLNLADAARLFGISRGAAYLAISRGELPTVHIGRRILIPLRAMEKLLERADLSVRDYQIQRGPCTMNLDESATGTVGLLPHQLADLRRSGLSDDTIRVSHRDHGRITETIRRLLGQIK
jgi:excisionase family DNA binding protein